jgi:hypothetical protein
MIFHPEDGGRSLYWIVSTYVSVHVNNSEDPNLEDYCFPLHCRWCLWNVFIVHMRPQGVIFRKIVILVFTTNRRSIFRGAENPSGAKAITVKCIGLLSCAVRIAEVLTSHIQYSARKPDGCQVSANLERQVSLPDPSCSRRLVAMYVPWEHAAILHC